MTGLWGREGQAERTGLWQPGPQTLRALTHNMCEPHAYTCSEFSIGPPGTGTAQGWKPTPVSFQEVSEAPQGRGPLSLLSPYSWNSCASPQLARRMPAD